MKGWDFMLSTAAFAALFDHTLLKPDATPAQIEALCQEAQTFGFASVCVNPCYVPLAARLLSGSAVRVCTVVGFPLGATTSEQKAHEAASALAAGAQEVDMVLSVGSLKAGDTAAVQADIAQVRAAAQGATLKVILETCLLTPEEIVTACGLCQAAGADFVKTSTGFSTAGATAEDVALMRRIVGPDMGVKAAGGIRTLDDALRMLEAGANRLGCSASVTIVRDYASRPR
jgi:deoxyribose-phosphate aldolase